MILRVDPEVLRQVVDAIREQRHLNLRRTGVEIMEFEISDDRVFLLFTLPQNTLLFLLFARDITTALLENDFRLDYSHAFGPKALDDGSDSYELVVAVDHLHPVAFADAGVFHQYCLAVRDALLLLRICADGLEGKGDVIKGYEGGGESIFGERRSQCGDGESVLDLERADLVSTQLH